MTRPWGLEVDRVELTLGSLLKAPEGGPSGPFIMPPSVPGLEGLTGLTGPIQQLAMHFLGQSGISQPQQGMASHAHTCFRTTCTHPDNVVKYICGFFSSDDSITFTDELSSAPQAAVATPGSVEELLGGVKLLLSETLVHQIGACFQFDISLEDGQHHSYYVDLSQGDGS